MTCFGNSAKRWRRRRILRLTPPTSRPAPGAEYAPPAGRQTEVRLARRQSPAPGCRHVVARRSRRARRHPFTGRQQPPYVVRRRASVGMGQGKRSASVRTASGSHSHMAHREFPRGAIVRASTSACRWSHEGRRPPHHRLPLSRIATSRRRNAAPTSDGWPRAEPDSPIIQPS